VSERAISRVRHSIRLDPQGALPGFGHFSIRFVDLDADQAKRVMMQIGQRMVECDPDHLVKTTAFLSSNRPLRPNLFAIGAWALGATALAGLLLELLRRRAA
jgi:hypothetical protein